MYDVLLSPQWIFDRCIEGSYYLWNGWEGFELSVVGFALFITILLFGLHHTKPVVRILSGFCFLLTLLCSISVAVWVGPIYFGALLSDGGMYSGPSDRVAMIAGSGFVLICMALILATGYGSFLRLRKHIGYMVVYLLAVIALSIPVVFGALFGALTVCSASEKYYPGIRYAHELHGVMKTYHDGGQPWPQGIPELRKLDEAAYAGMTSHARISYIADSEHDRFTLLVRPSKYSVFVFDSLKDFAVYSLPPFRYYGGDTQYPPPYYGPWDRLP